MAVAGAPRSFEDKYKFTVEINGVAHAKFNKCSELSAELDKIEYREGGDLRPTVKDPGLLNFTDVTLERGAVAIDSDLYDWFEETVDYATNTGAVGPTFKRDFDIVARDRDGTELKRWRCTNAWPVKFTAGEWDNDASEKTVEMITLTYDGFKRRVNIAS